MAAHPQIPDEQTRALVRERLVSGRLPRVVPETVYAGRGTSTRCAVCSQPITPQQIEYEIAVSGAQPLVFHMQCHDVWLTECRQDVGVGAGGNALSGVRRAVGTVLQRGRKFFSRRQGLPD